jgi:hypothetical protein
MDRYLNRCTSDIRNSLYGKGSYETTALDYNKVNSNITSALQLVSKMPSASLTGASASDWQQIQKNLTDAQTQMNAAIDNKGTDMTAAQQRSTAFVAAKVDLTSAQKLAIALGYKV